MDDKRNKVIKNWLQMETKQPQMMENRCKETQINHKETDVNIRDKNWRQLKNVQINYKETPADQKEIKWLTPSYTNWLETLQKYIKATQIQAKNTGNQHKNRLNWLQKYTKQSHTSR